MIIFLVNFMGMKILKEMDLKSTNLVTQANNLVESRYSITKNEQLIILAMISFIDPKDKEFLTYKTSITQFSKLLGFKKKNYIKEIDYVTSRLLSRVITLNTPNGWTKLQWVSRAQADFKEDWITLQFHEDLKPYLLDLKSRFTSFKLSEVIEFKSIYSIRIYQILRDFDGLKKTEFTYAVEDFKKIVLGDRPKDLKKYPRFNNFKQFTINVAKKELDEKANLSFTFETIRVGRSIGKIKFTIVKKAKVKEIKAPTEPKEPQTTEQILLDYEVYGVMQGNVEPFLRERGEQALTNTLNYFKQELASGKQVKNKGAYLFALLKNNAGQEVEEEKQEAERKKQARLEALKKEAEERSKQERLEAEKQHLRTVKEMYLSFMSSKQKDDLLSQLKAQYEKDHGDNENIKDIESVFLCLYLNKIVRDLPQYKDDLEEMIEAIILENRVKGVKNREN
jgi:plasmid replication initiation protein